MASTRILVLADVHYPHTVMPALEAALSEPADRVVLLGDAVDSPSSLPDLLNRASSSGAEVVLVRGDNEERMGIPGLERYEPDGMGVVLLHGHRGNLLGERFTKAVARAGARVSRGLVLGAYAMRVRVRGRVAVVGHAHALGYSRRFRVVFAGSLSQPSPSRPFNEVGYAVIEGGEVELRDGAGRRVLSVPLRP